MLSQQQRLLVADPLALKTIVSNMDMFPRSPQQHRLAHVLLGDKSLFSVYGTDHKKLRGMYNPVFSAHAVKNMADVMHASADNVCTPVGWI
jgi:cytochrome P450